MIQSKILEVIQEALVDCVKVQNIKKNVEGVSGILL
jgi:hypothetical protein